MKRFKSHLWYHKSQRNGVFILATFVVVFQFIIVFVDFCSDQKVAVETSKTLAFYKKIDSLKAVSIQNRKPKIYPFNPNYITDYKAGQLGMSLSEIDRLLVFRQTGKFVHSKKEFQKVTAISDSLLNAIAPYFKFPDWVVKSNQNTTASFSGAPRFYPKKKKHTITTKDINRATKEDLKTVYGVGEKLSERIIKYRSKLQGFSMSNQLYEVWGLEAELVVKLLLVFKVIELPNIQKQNVNTVSFKELLKNPYIDYELCKMIFN